MSRQDIAVHLIVVALVKALGSFTPNPSYRRPLGDGAMGGDFGGGP